MEKYGFVYIWFDRKHKRFYVGCHWGHEDDGYICSSTWMRDAYRRRPQDFKRRIIMRIYSSRKDLFEEEYRILSLIPEDELGTRYYNLSKVHPNHWSTDPNSTKTIKQKLRDAWQDEEVRQDRIIKKSKTMKLKHQDPEYREIYMDSRKKIDMEAFSKSGIEARKGMTPWNKGLPRSEETKAKISKTLKSQNREGTFKGRTHTEEAKRKMSEAKKGRIPWNKGISKRRDA